MYVMILTCDFGAFYEDMGVSLTIWTQSALDNASIISFAVSYLGCMSGGRINIEILLCSALSLLYGGHILFVDIDFHK